MFIISSKNSICDVLGFLYIKRISYSIKVMQVNPVLHMGTKYDIWVIDIFLFMEGVFLFFHFKANFLFH